MRRRGKRWNMGKSPLSLLDASKYLWRTPDSELQIVGFLCTVDLFPVIDNETPSGFHISQYDHEKSSSSSSSSHYSPTTPSCVPSTSQTPRVASDKNDIVHWVGNVPITESSKVTDALVGATFVQPMFIDLDSDKALIFVFPVRTSQTPLLHASHSFYCCRTSPSRSKAHFCFGIACLICFQRLKGGMTESYKQNVMVVLSMFILPRSSPACKRRPNSQRSITFF